MNEIDQKKDLIEFINNEKLKIPISNNDIVKFYKYFYKLIIKSLFEIYSKIKDINNLDIDRVVINGMNMIHYIYSFILSYTNNIKLTMFFSERAILLYTEFIIMSRNPILNNDLNFIPSINDALQFVYKKTIGPIQVNNLNSNSNINLLNQICCDTKLILHYIFKYTHLHIDNDNYNKDYIENIISCLGSQLLILYKFDDNNIIPEYIYNIIILLEQKFTENPIKSLHLFKIYLELFEEIYLISLDLDKTIFIMNNSIENIFNIHNIESISLDVNNFKIKKKSILYTNIKKQILQDFISK